MRLCSRGPLLQHRNVLLLRMRGQEVARSGSPSRATGTRPVPPRGTHGEGYRHALASIGAH